MRLHSERKQTKAFAWILGCEVAASVVVGLAYTFTLARHIKLGLDSIAYMLLGGSLAAGDGYSNPALLYGHGIKVPTANFPPAYPLFLAGLHDVGVTTPTGEQIAGAMCGGVTVLLTGLLGRMLTGRPGVGLLAGALVGLSPAIIAADGSIMSETIALPLTVAVLLSAAWAARSKSLMRWMLAGTLGGLLALVRSEDLLVAVVLVPVAVLVASSQSIGRRVAQMTVALLATAAVVAPWMIRNYETFTPPILLSTNDGKTLAGANCPATYEGPLIGYWEYSCLGHTNLANTNEAEYDKVLQREGFRYLRSHIERLPLVVVVRVLRAWGIFNPFQQAQLASTQTRSVGWQELAWPISLVTLITSIPALVRLRKDRLAFVLMGGPAVLSTLVVAGSFGNPRYVLTAFPSLCIGAAFTAALLSGTARHRRRSSERVLQLKEHSRDALECPVESWTRSAATSSIESVP